MPTLKSIHTLQPINNVNNNEEEEPLSLSSRHFTPIQSRRFRTPLPCWSLCPSMDLIALGIASSSTNNNNSSSASLTVIADSVSIYRIVSWQRLLSLPSKELSSFQISSSINNDGNEGGTVDWDLAEDGYLMNNSDRHEEEEKAASKNTHHEEEYGATSLTWSPDGRHMAIGLQDGGVLIYSIEAFSHNQETTTTGSGNNDDDVQRERVPLHILRTARHATEIIEEKKMEEEEEETTLTLLPKITPRVTRSMAKREQEMKQQQQQQHHTDDDNNQVTTTPDEPKRKYATAILGLTWKRYAPYHTSWSTSPHYYQYETNEMWRYTSQFLHRQDKFLPSECCDYRQGENSTATLFSPLSHLNVLFVATRYELHWYLQSRYRIMTTSLDNFNSSNTHTTADAADDTTNENNNAANNNDPIISKVNMVSSPDTSTVYCTAQYTNGNFASHVQIYMCPLLSIQRFDLQILAASYRSIFTRLRIVKRGIRKALTSWGVALRPLDTKFERLYQLLRNYNVVTTPNNNGATATAVHSHSIREELKRYILSGRSTVVGDASNALDQFFTRADMHDQLLLREANGVKAGLASMEGNLRSVVQSQIRAIAYEVDELYGRIQTHYLTVTECNLVEADVGLRLYKASRLLYLTFERFMAHVVEARSRLNDFLAWMRGTATEIRARGTAADSILRQHARDRRCPHGVVCRVTDFLSAPMISPRWDGLDDDDHGDSIANRKLTECIVGIPLSDNLAPQTEGGSSTNREPTLNSALFETFHITAALFDQPRSVFSKSLNERVMVFDVQHSLIALHTRLGADSNDPVGKGFFSPQLKDGQVSSVKSPYWIMAARTIALAPGEKVLELIAMPTDVLATSSDDEGEVPSVISMAFYSDDGNSSLALNLDIDAESKEGKQSLGLVVKNRCKEELWKFQYDNVLFVEREVNIVDKTICITSRVDAHSCPILSMLEDEDGEVQMKNPLRNLLAERIITTSENDQAKQKSQLDLCGSRGTGGVLTFGQSNALEIFDLEEDEDADDDSDEEIDDA
eukprot:scaffold16470_cov61-Cyclotella_meneghiniana.AAC.9